MKILVVYYSLEGNTDYIAQMIARKCGAVLERLRPENEPPKNALRYIIGGREAIRNEKARLNTTVYDPEAYDMIVVGSPVWAGRMTPAVREYLVSHPFEGKKTAIFACSASGKADRTIDGIACMAGGIYLALFSGVLHKEVSGRGALYTLAGLTYPCVLFGILMVISVSRIWWQTLVLACASTWICDSAALFGGTRFGKHKLAPLVSPKKTWEGSICGALSSLVTGVICWLLFRAFSPIPFWVCMLTSFVASTMGQIGDLAESLLKRMIGVKDFSNLIPGHGGVFDRADSLLFSIPTVYLFFLLAKV